MAGNNQSMHRVHYFSGQLLSAQDFQTEQDYFRGRLRRHNRLLHGRGVVFGLQVELSPDGLVTVHPGVALDCQGNELVVDEPIMCPLPQQGSRLYVALSYTEWLDEALPRLDPPGEGDEIAYSRVMEGVQVNLLDENPADQHTAVTFWAGCEQPHAQVLARLVRKGERWKLDKRFLPQQARPPRRILQTTRIRKKKSA